MTDLAAKLLELYETATGPYWTLERAKAREAIIAMTPAVIEALDCGKPRRYVCERCGGIGTQEEGRYWSMAERAYVDMPEQACQTCGGTGELGIVGDRIPRHIHERPKYEPTPAEIAADAAAIRAGWSEREERKRTRQSEPYEVPRLRVIR